MLLLHASSPSIYAALTAPCPPQWAPPFAAASLSSPLTILEKASCSWNCSVSVRGMALPRRSRRLGAVSFRVALGSSYLVSSNSYDRNSVLLQPVPIS